MSIWEPSGTGLGGPVGGGAGRPRLARSRTERVWKGVCGGLAETLGVQPVIVRLIVVALAVLHPLAVLIGYVIVAHLMPVRGSDEVVAGRRFSGSVSPALLGWAAIAIGGLILLHRLSSLLNPGIVVAVIAVVVGFTLLSRRRG